MAEKIREDIQVLSRDNIRPDQESTRDLPQAVCAGGTSCRPDTGRNHHL